MSKSTTKREPSKEAVLKAARAYKAKHAVPLTVHPSGKFGRWCKKVSGVAHYFGLVDPASKDYGSKAALALYHRQREDLEAGREPAVEVAGATVKTLCDAFLFDREQKVDTGELMPRSWRQYRQCCERLVKVLGRGRAVENLRPSDFATLRAFLSKSMAASTLTVELTRVKTVFRFAYDRGMIPVPMRFGGALERPPKRLLREARNGNGDRDFTAGEVKAMVAAADPCMKCLVLLGINAAFGPTDFARVPLSAIDLDGGWITYPRHKTGVPRRAKLWPETTAAIRSYIDRHRPEPVDDKAADYAFLQADGRPWVSDRCDLVSAHARRLMQDAGVWRKGRGIYGLRRSFRTVADEVRDTPAIDLIMGHSDASMGAAYRMRIDDARLKTVATRVRTWLGKAGKIE